MLVLLLCQLTDECWYTFPFSSNCVSPDGPIVGGNWTIQGDSVVSKCLYSVFA